jgi:hypothetical protein
MFRLMRRRARVSKLLGSGTLRLRLTIVILIDQVADNRRSLLGENSEAHDQLLVREVVVF